MQPLAQDSEIQDLMVECCKSTKMTAKVFLEERFYAPFNDLHDQMFDLIDSGAPRVVIAAPRGIGKTSICFALATRKILFQDAKFIPLVSTTFDSACMQTENLKHELMSNKMIQQLFPPVHVKLGEGVDPSFSKKSWVAMDTLIYPRGSGQQIRGILFRNSRPDLFIVDDLEDPETIQNDDIRRKRKEWFHSDLEKAVSRLDKNWQIIYIDTLKHEDSLLQSLLDSDNWASIRLEICDDELNSKAPEFMSSLEIREEHEYHRKEGILDVFYREFRNIPISLEDAVFKPEYFKPYNEDGDRLRIYTKDVDKPEYVQSKDLINVVICDPAKTIKLQSSDTAIGVIGVSRSSRKIFVREVVSGKFTPNEMYDHMFRLVLEYNAMFLAVEVTSLHQFISQPIENQMKVRGIFPIYMELKAVKSKEERVATLAPLYKLGYIYHNENCCQKLESQLIGFPRSKFWDCMDMLAYITKIMDDQAMYFDPEDMNEEDIEKEYDELEDDKIEEVEWLA